MSESPVVEGQDGAQTWCRVEAEYSDRINFAMQQNGVALVDSLRLTATGPEPLENVTLRLELENGEAAPFEARFSRLEPGVPALVTPAAFTLSGAALAARTEAERSTIIATVTHADRTARFPFPIDLLPFDQWPGVGHYPELTAAFVTPNHARIADLLGEARGVLRSAGGPDSLDGYQSGSRQRVAQIAEACFLAAARQGIGYINPPASFESSGQRIRLVDRLMRERLGTCLDLSILLMSMWEQCGLHPLLLLPQGHAIPAVWTHDAHLPEAAIDEPARIRNLIELGEFVPVESTHLTDAGAGFNAAVAAAKQHMERPGADFCAIDIRSGRKRGIRPLPLRNDAEGLEPGAVARLATPAETGPALDRIALAERAEAIAAGEAAALEPQGRIERWRTRLLDLSLRNRLLNFRETGRVVRLLTPAVAAVEDALAEGRDLRILSKSNTAPEFLKAELDAGHLYSTSTEAETQAKLLNLYRIARASIEETGANLLHLALGMLRWYETTTSDDPRLAPLILLPVTLKRTATGSGYHYTISLSDEPLRPNVTLLEKLRTEFGIDTGGLDELPEDEQGLDVDLILRKFRQAIRDAARWEVVEESALGLFSFNKFLMWRDLTENLGKLRSNRLVDHLVERPGDLFDPKPLPAAKDLDAAVPPGRILCTRDADSSQLAAVRAAAESRTFVLEGPPGTGKSQTIANIIADSLAAGKRVLFVAEKMAALSVVRKRLEDDGLGAYCLELHSAKASKKEVLAQLAASLQAERLAPPAEWESLCSDLGGLRGKLNDYVDQMHTARPSGETLYQVLGRLCRLGDGAAAAPDSADIGAVTAGELAKWRSLVADLQRACKAIDPPGEHALRGIGRTEWSFGLGNEAAGVIGASQDALAAMAEAAAAFVRGVGGTARASVLSGGAHRALAAAAALLAKCPGAGAALITGRDAAALRGQVLEACDAGRKRDAHLKTLMGRYKEEFAQFDPLPLLARVETALAKPALLRWFASFGIKGAVRPYCRAAAPDLATLRADLEMLREARRLDAELTGRADLAAVLGMRWRNSKADWDELAALVGWCEKFAACIAAADADRGAAGLGERLVQAAASPPAAPLGRACTELVAARGAWDQAWAKVAALLRCEDGDSAESEWLLRTEDTLTRWHGGLAELDAWCGWRSARDAAAVGGLAAAVELYEAGGCGREQIGDAFERGYGRAWFNAVADATPAVRGFSAEGHADAIERFAELDRRCIALTRYVVCSWLAAGRPDEETPAAAQSELGILRREMEKKRRHLPTRRLIESIPSLLPRLKPCFLMSPLSVAQFLDAGLPPFDMVVFDEASQIPVWDAVGAVARGREVIVVGDSKQLPPTSFFSTLEGEDDEEPDEAVVDDMESILQECNASGIPAMRLKWHYRSRHETLIAFSNHHYYHNELHTFPSPEDRSERLGVSMRYIGDGVYDRGGTRTNRIEAERVVAAVVEMLEAPGATGSIGVVTFNQAQQTLIEDLFDTARRAHPGIETFFTEAVMEPVFIKNLENVQGDERDVIIFSVGYGPDQSGRPSMNFGPLNKEGGERRLNVAVTRARRQLMVFSSLRSEQIDLKRTRAQGVRDFKTFLDYAERGPAAIAQANLTGAGSAHDAGLEAAVRDALVEAGWEVDSNVGCGGYRIDLAVRDPRKPGAYLIGIECDGAAYRGAANARDRDRLRGAVLRNLGWRLERVWSTEWRINRARAAARLLAAVERAAAGGGDVAADAAVEAAPTVEPLRASLAVRAVAATELVAGGPPVYCVAEIDALSLRGFDFFGPAALARAERALVEIVGVEGPITPALVAKRMAGLFGVQRMTARFHERCERVAAGLIERGEIVLVDDAYWPAGADSADARVVRVPGEGAESQRGVEELPRVELRNAVVWVLRAQFGLPREDLVRETARLLGLGRATIRISEPIGAAIDDAIAAGLAERVGERIMPR